MSAVKPLVFTLQVSIVCSATSGAQAFPVPLGADVTDEDLASILLLAFAVGASMELPDKGTSAVAEEGWALSEAVGITGKKYGKGMLYCGWSPSFT